MAVAQPSAAQDLTGRPRVRRPPGPPPLDEAGIRRAIAEILNRHPAVGMAVGVVRHRRLEVFQGHGLANITTKTPVTQDTVFRVGSISKTFTAIAVMQLRELGLVDLDAPANDYLRAFKLVPARPEWPATTVRQLLTHTGGVPEQAHPWGILRPDYGETVPLGQPVPALAEYYRGGLRVRVEPGRAFIYGDHGIAALGQIVEDLSGQPLAAYLREHIFEPLGMADSDFERSPRVTANLATGYRITRRGPTAVVDREMIPGAAGRIYSTTGDMARYAAALLNGGAGENGSVLTPATVATMFAPHLQPDARLPGMGLTFFRGDLGGHHAVEHQGIVPGFNSQLWIAPDDDTTVLAFTNGSPRAVMWMPVEVGRLLGGILGTEARILRADVPQHPEVWDELVGWYRHPIPLTDVRSRKQFGAGLEVFVRGGDLWIRFLNPVPVLYRGMRLHPESDSDPYLFATDSFGRVAFSRDASTETVTLTLELMPIALRHQPDSTNPFRRTVRVAGAVATLSAAALAIRRRTQKPTQQMRRE